MDNNALENNLIQSLLSEQKSARRWKNARFIVWLLLTLIFVVFVILPNFTDETHLGSTDSKEGYVSLLRLNGVIAAGQPFSAAKVNPELTAAFRDKDSKGVVLLINSPGGSPVQASLIHDKIMQLKEKYHKKVIVVGEDTLASGAYLVSTAADKIFVNNDTVTGSIGVIMEGFGFEDAIAKLGVTRRVYTAGNNKDRLDPFVASNPADKEKIKTILDAVHQDFINDVEQGRKGKLTGDPSELFSGDFWTGTQAVKLGLVDATATPWVAMKGTFGTTHYRDYSPQPGILESIMHGVSMKLPLGLVESHATLQEVV